MTSDTSLFGRCGMGVSPLELLSGGIASQTAVGFLAVASGHRPILVRKDKRSISEHIGDVRNSGSARAKGLDVPPDPYCILGHEGASYTIRPYMDSVDTSVAGILPTLGTMLSLVHKCDVPWRRPSVYRSIASDLALACLRTSAPDPISSAVAEVRVMYSTGSLNEVLRPALELTHGDFMIPNIVVRQDSRVVLIDWEKSGSCSQEFDLAMAIYYLCDPGLRLHLNNILTFINAYDNLKKLDRGRLRLSVDCVGALSVVRDWSMMIIDERPERREHYRREALPVYLRYESMKTAIRQAVFGS
jgi:hypothetical protein